MGSQYDLFNGPEKIIARFLSLTIPSLFLIFYYILYTLNSDLNFIYLRVNQLFFISHLLLLNEDKYSY